MVFTRDELSLVCTAHVANPRVCQNQGTALGGFERKLTANRPIGRALILDTQGQGIRGFLAQNHIEVTAISCVDGMQR